MEIMNAITCKISHRHGCYIIRTHTLPENRVKSENERSEFREKICVTAELPFDVVSEFFSLIQLVFLRVIFCILKRNMHDAMANIWTGIKIWIHVTTFLIEFSEKYQIYFERETENEEKNYTIICRWHNKLNEKKRKEKSQKTYC